MNQEAISRFAARLLHATTMGHMLHLQSRSYAQHKALEDFYSGVVDLADSFIEAFQGSYATIIEYPSGFDVPSKDALAEIEMFSDSVKSMRKYVPDDTELQNIIDEIQALADSTLYKLRFLA